MHTMGSPTAMGKRTHGTKDGSQGSHTFAARERSRHKSTCLKICFPEIHRISQNSSQK